MELHLAIKKVLQQQSKPMTVKEITDAINDQGLCMRRNGSAICDFQVHSRSYNKQELFTHKGKMVSLKSSRKNNH